MSDMLLDLGQNPTARRLIKKLGLPIPVPEMLRRGEWPMEDRPFADLDVAVASSAKSVLLGTLAETLTSGGANVVDGVLEFCPATTTNHS